MDGLRPDWECVECGFGCWQPHAPIHCVRCGGTRFKKIGTGNAGEFDPVLGVLARIQRDAAAVSDAVRRSKHRRRVRLLAVLGQLEGFAAKMVRMVTVTDPVRPVAEPVAIPETAKKPPLQTGSEGGSRGS